MDEIKETEVYFMYYNTSSKIKISSYALAKFRNYIFRKYGQRFPYFFLRLNVWKYFIEAYKYEK